MAPLVSIALPVYNGERFIADAIESVLGQDVTDLELVIVDNASTDGTGDICQRFARRDGRVRYVRNDRNIGLSANFTRSCLLTTGRYFKWMAADDMLAPGYLRACVDALDGDPSLALVTPRPLLVGSDGRTPLEFQAEHGRYAGAYVERPYDDADALMAERPSARFAGVLLNMRGEAINNYAYGLGRGEVIRSLMPYGSFVGADKVLLANVSLIGKVRLLDDVLFIWRHHPAQFSVAGFKGSARLMSPSARQTRSWMVILQGLAYLKMVVASPISPAQRLRCLVAIFAKAATGSVRQIRAFERESRTRPARS